MIQTTIKLIKKEIAPGGDIVFLWFTPRQKFEFKEGQFFMFSSPKCKDEKGNMIKRAYSIATTNQELQKNNQIGFIVKKASEQGMSNFLVNELQTGEEIQANGPTGILVDNNSHQHYLLICNGSGLSPIYGHYEHLTKESKQFKKIVTIFGERYQSHLLKSVEENFQTQSNKIKNMIFLSKEEKLKPSYHHGHVQDGIDEALQFLQTKNIKAIICGKPAMANECASILTQKGILESQIIIEKY